MSDHLPPRSEWVSALMDGELRGAAFAQTVEVVVNSPDARDDWDTYHLVGAALRSHAADLRMHDPDFVERLRDRLSREPLQASAPVISSLATSVVPVPTPAANSSSWLRAVGMASVAAIALGLWQGWQSLGGGAQQGAPALAQLSSPGPVGGSSVAVSSPQDTAVMLRDPRLDALLAAHRQRGGVSALQMPAGFLRNATFDEAGR